MRALANNNAMAACVSPHVGRTVAACTQMRNVLPGHQFALGTMSKVDQDHFDLQKGGCSSSYARASMKHQLLGFLALGGPRGCVGTVASANPHAHM